MLKIFRIASVLEGISYFLILSVTVGFVSREYVFPLGAAHGCLFILYIYLSLQVSHKQGWSILVWFLVFLAAMVPFAFVVVEVYLRKQLIKNETSAT